MYNNLFKRMEKYFDSFKDKDIDSLSKLFDNDVVLFDPVVQKVIGKENVLEINKNIFNDCNSIKFTKKDIFIDENKMTGIGEVEFFCGETKINVADIISFNSNQKINSIIAYMDTTVFNKEI